MKNLISVILVVFLPLTLASQTQHRFQVYVRVVEGDDATLTSLITSHLKRELRALGDVDIVGHGDDWEYTIGVIYLEHERGGVKTGTLSIASTMQVCVPKFYFSDAFVNTKAVIPGNLRVATWSKDTLQEWCISEAGDFNDKYLEFFRSLWRK